MNRRNFITWFTSALAALGIPWRASAKERAVKGIFHDLKEGEFAVLPVDRYGVPDLSCRLKAGEFILNGKRNVWRDLAGDIQVSPWWECTIRGKGDALTITDMTRRFMSARTDGVGSRSVLLVSRLPDYRCQVFRFTKMYVVGAGVEINAAEHNWFLCLKAQRMEFSEKTFFNRDLGIPYQADGK